MESIEVGRGRDDGGGGVGSWRRHGGEHNGLMGIGVEEGAEMDERGEKEG